MLLWIAVRQWWKARDGGPDAIRRAGIVLFAASILSPATLPWYVSWGMALLAMGPWTVRGLQYMVVVSLMLVVVYYPNGEDGLYNWGYLAFCLAVAVLAAWSLVRPDPLRLAAGARGGPAPDAADAPDPMGDVASEHATAPVTAEIDAPSAAVAAPVATPAPAGAEQRAS